MSLSVRWQDIETANEILDCLQLQRKKSKTPFDPFTKKTEPRRSKTRLNIYFIHSLSSTIFFLLSSISAVSDGCCLFCCVCPAVSHRCHRFQCGKLCSASEVLWVQQWGLSWRKHRNMSAGGKKSRVSHFSMQSNREKLCEKTRAEEENRKIESD